MFLVLKIAIDQHYNGNPLHDCIIVNQDNIVRAYCSRLGTEIVVAGGNDGVKYSVVSIVASLNTFNDALTVMLNKREEIQNET